MENSLTLLSDSELDEVSAGKFTLQVSLLNAAAGVQQAPTLNISGAAFFVGQTGASQAQIVNGGNIGSIHL